jgi:hypothetical protein
VLRLTVSTGLALCLSLGVVTLGTVALPPAAPAAPDGAEDPAAAWQQRWDKTLKDAATEYDKLSKKYEEKLEYSSAYLRRFVLRYQPDEPATRDFLGYKREKDKDGADIWVRYDVRRDQINELTDLADPKRTKFGADHLDLQKKIVGWFKSLARKAAENATAKDISPDAAKEWKAKEAMAWERVLQIDEGKPELVKDMDEAHKALGHPKYEGKLVSPFKLQYLKARAERKKAGEKTAGTKITGVEAVECEGMFVTAGMAGGGAKSAHFVVNTIYGKEVAIRLVQNCEKAMNDLIEVYGFPPDIRDRISLKFNIIKHEDAAFHQFLEKGAGWKPAEVQKYLDHHLSGTSAKGEHVSMSQGGADADDLVMNTIASHLVPRAAQANARADLGSATNGELDDWLWLAMGYDVTKRVLGTALTTWGGFGRYGEAIEPRPGEDKWLELARRLVINDDDTSISKLAKLEFDRQEFKPKPQIKAWALLQFVFEKDPEKAKKFVWHVLAEGTPAAVAAIYPNDLDSPDVEKSMESLDAEYREWIVKAF